MATLVLPSAFVLITCALVARGRPWRNGLLEASIIWGAACALITEGLGTLGQLNGLWVGLCWLVLCVAAGSIGLHKLLVDRIGYKLAAGVALDLRPGGWACLALVLLLGAAEAVVAVVAPPNTWDSMTYHLSRVMHWIEDGSLANYPTHIPRQLHAPPWAEFAIANLQMLSGGDRFANMVQLISMICAICGVTLIAAEFRANRQVQVLAALIAVTVPEGLLQATGTQNNYSEALWLVCVALLTLRIETRQSNWYPLVLSGFAALALSLLTKGTGYVFATPFLVWMVATAAWRYRRRSLAALTAGASLILVLNLGAWIRNYSLYGNPLGPPDEGAPALSYTNESFSLATTTSNILRNIGIESAVPNDGLDRALEEGIVAVHHWIGISVDDPSTTWQGTTFHVTYALHEDVASSPVHMLLVLICLPAAALLRRLPGRRTIVAYVGAIAAAFLLFCTIFRWQPYHVRLTLPLMLLCAPVIALVASRLPRLIQVSIVVLLLILAVPSILLNQSRPLVGPLGIFTVDRTQQYFVNRPGLAASYAQATSSLVAAGCRRVGLISGPDDWEYPLWVLMADQRSLSIRIWHVDVTNETAPLQQPGKLETESSCATVILDSNGAHLAMDSGAAALARLPWQATRY